MDTSTGEFIVYAALEGLVVVGIKSTGTMQCAGLTEAARCGFRFRCRCPNRNESSRNQRKNQLRTWKEPTLCYVPGSAPNCSIDHWSHLNACHHKRSSPYGRYLG